MNMYAHNVTGSIFSEQEINANMAQYYSAYANAFDNDYAEPMTVAEFEKATWDKFTAVVENVPGAPGYDENYGEWRPVA